MIAPRAGPMPRAQAPSQPGWPARQTQTRRSAAPWPSRRWPRRRYRPSSASTQTRSAPCTRTRARPVIRAAAASEWRRGVKHVACGVNGAALVSLPNPRPSCSLANGAVGRWHQWPGLAWPAFPQGRPGFVFLQRDDETRRDELRGSTRGRRTNDASRRAARRCSRTTTRRQDELGPRTRSGPPSAPAGRVAPPAAPACAR